jgi:PleD family two-component response regulator
MPSSMLSPSVSYYIRKLIRQNIDQLQSITPGNVTASADPLSDFSVLLEQTYQEPSELKAILQELETRVITHQTLASQGSRYRRELLSQETKIFELLGLQYQKPARQGKILVVDDMADNLNLLSRTLKREGYEIQTACTGQEALTILMGFTPDLILLDIVMPGMSGFEVCIQLKKSQRHSTIPIIFISAMNEVAHKVKAFELGGADYITRPFHIDEVLVRVAHQIDLTTIRKRLEDQNLRLQAEIQERRQMEIQLHQHLQNS